MASVGQLTALECLSLSFTGVTDVGLREVAHLSSLRCLNLDSRQFTGAPRCLHAPPGPLIEHLAGLMRSTHPPLGVTMHACTQCLHCCPAPVPVQTKP